MIKKTMLISSINDALKLEEGASAQYLNNLRTMAFHSHLKPEVVVKVRQRIEHLILMNGHHQDVLNGLLKKLAAEKADAV